MAEKEKKVKSPEQTDKAGKKAEKAKKKPNIFVRAGKGIKNFFKTFRGETKKISWPDAKTVWKNTGIVLVMVLIIGVIIFGIDTGLSEIILAIKKLAGSATEAVIGSFLI